MASLYPWLNTLQELVPTLDVDAFRSDLQTCSNVSGYDFSATTRITAAQVSRTCADPGCASVEDVLLGRAAATDTDNGPLLRTVLNNFVRPMVEFCWLYRLPGQPCPASAEEQLYKDFFKLVSECEAANGTIDSVSITVNSSAVNTTKEISVKQPGIQPECTIPACAEFTKRKRALGYTLCLGSGESLISSLKLFCTAEWKNYEYLPGPVPIVPSESPLNSSTKAPTPPPDPQSNSTISSTAPVTGTEQNATSSNLPLVSTVSVIVVVLFAALMFLRWRRQRRNQPKKYDPTDTASPSVTSHTDFVSMGPSTLFGSSESSQRDYLPADCPYIPVHQLTQVRLIAAGASGLVYLVQDQHGVRYASKQLVNRQLNEDKIDAFIAEISIAASLKHPQIVLFIGVAGISRHHLQAIFEYMEGGDLRRYLDTTPWQPWNHTKLTIALDVAKALAYIHSFTGTVESTSSNGNTTSSKKTGGIVHRDLKSRNIMLTKELRAKVGDFGVSRTVSTQATMTAGVGTSRWLAPEVIVGNDGAYDAACDVYSFGVVLTELDSHRLPYYDSVTSTGEELPEIVILSRVADGSLRPSLLSSCLDDVAALVMKCLSFDPKERPAASELVEELTRILDTCVVSK